MEILKRSTAFKGYYQLDELTLRSTKSGREVNREQFLTPDSVGVLVLNSERQTVILVKQFRVGPEQELIEIVAGKVEGKDQNLMRTVKREVLEETGYEVNRLEHLYRFFTSPGPVTEEMNLYVAYVSNQSELGGGLDSEVEEIEILEWSYEQFLNYTFNDAKTIMAQQWMRINLKK